MNILAFNDNERSNYHRMWKLKINGDLRSSYLNATFNYFWTFEGSIINNRKKCAFGDNTKH